LGLASGAAKEVAYYSQALRVGFESKRTTESYNVTPILDLRPLTQPWEGSDPFLFCAYHNDAYPRGNGRMGPDASLAGRNLGSDFSRKDGWSMYHGDAVPGFPAHPHRGFETITIVRQGLIDHSDSLGATARYGHGDVQWLTAGRGIMHAEMFPLIDDHAPNPLELFQIWLNLPAASKMVPPHFTMMWSDRVPKARFGDDPSTDVTVIAGALEGAGAPLAPPPDSWAARAESDMAIWTIRMDAGARWTLPPAKSADNTRRLYFFAGSSISIDGKRIDSGQMITLDAQQSVELVNGDAVAEFLMLQSRPIGEPVAMGGPFVMNTQAEIQQAFLDFRRTQFGGWPWPDSAPVLGRDPARFARRPDGTLEKA
jgi:quercetin 2,3-dioxygenase